MLKGLKIVIAGGTGFIGSQMCTRWAKDNKVVVLSRGSGNRINNSYGQSHLVADIQLVNWDGVNGGDWEAWLEGCDILINLAGRTVNCRYNSGNRKEIISSRIDATSVLGKAIQQCMHPPKLWINGSSATIYRHAEDRPQDERTGEIENDFSVRVCKEWERAFSEADAKYTRKVVLRMAITLGKGGVLVPYSWLARLGVGGKHGNGRQLFSWIHRDDLLNIVEWLYNKPEAEGVYNAASPGPQANFQFMKLLREHYKMPVGIPAPAWMLEIAAFFHRTETELLLKSRWVLPTRLLDEGYEFQYPDLGKALEDLL